MWKKPISPTNSLAVSKSRQDFNRRLVQVLRDDSFLKELHALKGYIATGRAVDECRALMGIRSRKRWHLLLDALGRLTATPEKLYMEFHTRAQMRYSQILAVLQRAQKGVYTEEQFDDVTMEWKKVQRRGLTDSDMEAKMLLLLTRVDKQLVDLADKMGLLTMEDIPDSDGSGISNEQVRKELEKIDELISAQAAARARACEPISIGDEPHDDDERKADQVGPASLDELDPD